MSERESKTGKVADLDDPVTDKNAAAVKGGGPIVAPSSPILVKTINPRGIVPCV